MWDNYRVLYRLFSSVMSKMLGIRIWYWEKRLKRIESSMRKKGLIDDE